MNYSDEWYSPNYDGFGTALPCATATVICKCCQRLVYQVRDSLRDPIMTYCPDCLEDIELKKSTGAPV